MIAEAERAGVAAKGGAAAGDFTTKGTFDCGAAAESVTAKNRAIAIDLFMAGIRKRL